MEIGAGDPNGRFRDGPRAPRGVIRILRCAGGVPWRRHLGDAMEPWSLLPAARGLPRGRPKGAPSLRFDPAQAREAQGLRRGHRAARRAGQAHAPDATADAAAAPAGPVRRLPRPPGPAESRRGMGYSTVFTGMRMADWLAGSFLAYKEVFFQDTHDE